MRKKNKRIVKSRPKRIRTLDGFSNPLARLGDGTPNLLNGTVYSMKRLTRDFMLLNSLYREHWIIRRIIDIIPSDMLKNWITITTAVAPDVLCKVDIELRRTQLIQKIKRGLQWGRLYGGAIGLMLIKGQGDNLSEPLSLAKMVPGDFCGLLILDRWNGVNPSLEVIDDIGSPDYGLPKYYDITDTTTDETVRVHHSRVLRFIGDDLPYWESQMEQQWGASVIESIFDDLRKRDNVSWNIAQLTFMANLRVLKMQDMGQLLSAADTQSQKELYDTIQKQNWLMSNMGIQLMDAADSMESHQYTFSGISEVYQQFMMDISGAAQIPATKLYGRSPEGMNATGESDLQNYYDMIGQEQEAKLRPILNKLLPPLCMSVFGAVPDDLDFEFDPVSEPSDQERSDLAKSGTENVVTALNAGLVSKRTALKELKQQSERTGVWTNITDEDILKASDEIEEEGEMGGFPGMEGMMGEGGEEEKRPPQMPPEKPPQMPKQTQDSADNGDSEEVVWRTTKTGRKYRINTKTGRVVGGSPAMPIGKVVTESTSKEETINYEKMKFKDLSKAPMMSKINSTGVNKFPAQVFKNKSKAKNHYEKHKKELKLAGIKTFNDYVATTKRVIESPVGEDILGHATKGNQVVRYSINYNLFVKGNPDRGVFTSYIPDGKPGHYYQEQLQEDTKHDRKR